MVNSQGLLDWYDGLYSRTVDLVGDYAGDELFIIEGDSLLLHSFSDDKLDFSPGLQLLHATYIVENFLRALLQRKCKFNLVFFNKHAHLCIPRNTPAHLRSRYLLAREANIQHFKCNISLTTSSLEVKVFDSYSSQDFDKYLASTGAYFFMCHDGSFPSLDVQDKSEDDGDNTQNQALSELQPNIDTARISKEDKVTAQPMSQETRFDYARKVALRRMIHWFIGHSYNIALVTTVEFRDTKVMAMIVEGTRMRVSQPIRTQSNTSQVSAASEMESQADSEPRSPDTDRADYSDYHAVESNGCNEKSENHVPDSMQNGNPTEANIHVLLAKPLAEILAILERTKKPPLSQRDLLVVTALSLMFRSGKIGTAAVRESCAMLLHTIVVRECRLCDRVLDNTSTGTNSSFLTDFVDISLSILVSDAWRRNVLRQTLPCDLADMLDGRLFLNIASSLQWAPGRATLSPSMFSSFSHLMSLLKDTCAINVQLELEASGLPLVQDVRCNITTPSTQGTKRVIPTNGCEVRTTVLPFNNPVFDPHLAPIQLTIDVSARNENTTRIFKELSHWHNHRQPIDQKTIRAMTDWQKARANRRNQFFMKETRDYAASLTNAIGGVLEPETIIVEKTTGGPAKRHGASNMARREKKTPHVEKSQGSRANVKELANAIVLEKRSKDTAKLVEAWNATRIGLVKESNLTSRFLKAKNHLSSLAGNKREAVEADVSVYMLSILIEMWTLRCANEERANAMPIMGLIWNQILQIKKLEHGITMKMATYVANTIQALGLPALGPLQVQEKNSTGSTTVLFEPKRDAVGIQLSPLEFQLVHAGPFFDRDMGSAPDRRVHDFEPDKWQRDVLDQIDWKRSVFVVAPTSAGKTFISFYAMKQILEEDDDGVLVYVAPTKALVNQIAAEVQARFSKTFKYPGNSVWAIHTRDHRVNDPTGCQVLVTVPHMLQIMLLAPTNAKSWSSRVKRIIFDEIHCIGQADDGVVWEQLLLLAPCPIIALSATVGNPQEFSNWLSKTQETNGIQLEMIEHHHRYSDLRKYVYSPPQKFLFNGLFVRPQLPSVGIDNAPAVSFMHPVASLVDRSRGIPDDLTLEPRDCWTLWNAMKKHETQAFPVDESLNPSNCLPHIVRKVDIIEWEVKLKALLKTWVDDRESPFENVLRALEQSVRSARRAAFQTSSGKVDEDEISRPVEEDDFLDTTMPLICSLHDQGALPALFFNYDRNACELICQRLLQELQTAESRWKESSRTWRTKISSWEAWKLNQEKQNKKKAPKKTKGGNADDEPTTRAERMREANSEESNILESFDPNDPVEGFHLADMKKVSATDFRDYAKELEKRFVPDWLIDALRRGIGVHHAGMNRKYRQVCEMLFRKGYLRVVIATGTLALGINMPCKTVVFSGDSIFLTALNFRQAAGRAGRRGFDVLGNVVFQGIPYSKVCRLLSSRLPDLNGHFPITTTLVLRLFILLHESKHAAYAVKAINSILSSPRIYLGGPESKHTVLHHLRFSIEYLRRNQLLDVSGAPLNFTGCVSHLYYTGNASFAFHALLKSGYFSRLCRPIHGQKGQDLHTLMLVMSHLFGRRYLRQSVSESRRNGARWSSSLVILPPLPKEAARILLAHNDQTLDVYAAYVSTYIDQHVREPDHTLPLTGLKCGGDTPLEDIGVSVSCLPPPRINSAFVALSGHRDEWKSVSDLCKMVRSGVWLEEAVVPYVGTYPDESAALLNAYLYDFFKHGNVVALEKENRIRKGEIWFVLNDFSLVLATIVTSLENFLKLSSSAGNETGDIMGFGDVRESELDDKAVEVGLDNKATPSQWAPSSREPSKQESTATKAGSRPGKTKQVDSWQDELSDNGDSAETNRAIPETMGDAFKAAKAEKKGHAIDTRNAKKQPKASKAETEVFEFGEDGNLMHVLMAFTSLQQEFNEKFRAMWA
ncbi:hypothetical protein Z517_02473 [Fonsecaea pedrosoi CBS 271.37]|uniref:DEAD/DEAH box helicase n=1 Tax=Fonsecaea pedrosoi CBS 271.37 TaxID=1442368 RepID=A0A0D2GQF7_9EURO|nr:uncharacterized protein Z517_02473 [Fonsecaea pedrosoi CBS 271.37]KIW83228.1 hypothetical protein Z517_02473 [Fonsecaea pedrosoi CBS 271.37]